MLFDPKWEVQTKTDVFSLEGLIAWLEMKPALAKYDYHCMGECLLGLWTRSIDPKSVAKAKPRHSEVYVYNVLGKWCDLNAFGEIAQGNGLKVNWTFGAALDRARKALAS